MSIDTDLFFSAAISKFDPTLNGRVLRYFERVFVATLFAIVAEINSILLFVASCQNLIVAGCQIIIFLANKPMFLQGNRLTGNVISDQICSGKFGLEVIVAGCDPKLATCCKLRPKTLQLLRVAPKFLFVARCRIPQYVPNWSALISKRGMIPWCPDLLIEVKALQTYVHVSMPFTITCDLFIDYSNNWCRESTHRMNWHGSSIIQFQETRMNGR